MLINYFLQSFVQVDRIDLDQTPSTYMVSLNNEEVSLVDYFKKLYQRKLE